MSLTVAISGAGYVVPFHLQAWKKAGARVTAICDPDVDRACERAGAFGIGRVFRNLSDMLEAGGFDVLDIAAPREVHVEQCLAGLAAGLPILCQKPIAVDLDEAERLLARLTSGGRLMVHENWRFRPHYRQMANWLDDGRFGPLHHATITMRTRALLPDRNGLRPALQRQPFFATEKRMLVAEVLIHHLDTARRLCGELSLVDAHLLRTQSDLPGETCASITLRTDDGVPVIVSGDMTAHGAPPGAADRTEICGRNGRAVFDGGSLVLYTADRAVETIRFEDTDLLQSSFDAAIDHFAKQTINHGLYETSLADNIETLRLVEQVYGHSTRRIA